MKIRRGLFILILGIIMLAGCEKKSSTDLYQDIEINNNEIFLYNVVEEKLGIYNTEDFKWKSLYDEENTFQYVFNNDSDYVVSGNSVNNKFVLLKISKNRKHLQKVFELDNDNNCFFPLATDGEKYYFVLYVDEKSEVINRNIFLLTENYEINNILETNQMITSGVMIGTDLYYTVYNEKADKYNLYMLNDENNVSDIGEELETRELFEHKENICVSDYTEIYCNSKKLPKKYLNFIEEDFIIQFYANDENDMICTIRNINTDETLGTFLEPINYKIEEKKIIVYCQNKMHVIAR